MKKIKLSSLDHTWLIDLDGTLVKHNSHLFGDDELLEGVRELWQKIPANDLIIILTARQKKYEERTINFLAREGIRHNKIIFDLPTGERILINDIKPLGLKTAIAVNVKRNEGLSEIICQETL